MSDSSSALIIPFPARAPSQPAPTPVVPTAAEARLANALDSLNNALAAQRLAMAAWRASLADLRAATSRLGGSLRGYSQTLDRLDARVRTVRTEAVKLEQWADGVLARES